MSRETVRMSTLKYDKCLEIDGFAYLMIPIVNVKEIEAPNNSGRGFQAPTSISKISIDDLYDVVNEI